MTDVAEPATIERDTGAVAPMHTCERNWRVIRSIATRPRWTPSVRALISPVRLIVTSTSANVASERIEGDHRRDQDLGQRHAAF